MLVHRTQREAKAMYPSEVYGRFPDGYFPGWFFPGKTFPGWSFSRMRRFPERLRER